MGFGRRGEHVELGDESPDAHRRLNRFRATDVTRSHGAGRDTAEELVGRQRRSWRLVGRALAGVQAEPGHAVALVRRPGVGPVARPRPAAFDSGRVVGPGEERFVQGHREANGSDVTDCGQPAATTARTPAAISSRAMPAESRLMPARAKWQQLRKKSSGITGS